MTVDLQKIKRDAINMAAKVGEVQMDYFRTSSVSIDTKGNPYDVVTQVDRKCEEILINEISRLYPDHSILGEETGEHKKDSDWQWVIDPLDGTNNYSQGLPIFCVSIGVQYKGVSQVGVVYMPYLDELYTAVRGQGAMMQMGLCMGELLPPDRLRCSKKTDIHQCVIATDFPYDRATNPINNIAAATRIIPLVRGFRGLGSAAYDLCSVAMGTLDCYWELDIKPWDVAAASLIAEEAGAVTESLREDRHVSIITANPTILKEIRKYIDEE